MSGVGLGKGWVGFLGQLRRNYCEDSFPQQNSNPIPLKQYQ